MKSVLLVAAASLAAILLPTASSSAQEFTSDSHVRLHSTLRPKPFAMRRSFGREAGSTFCDGRDGRHRDERGRDRRDVVSECGAFPADFGYFDQDINQSWDPDSFNDWWNDRPDRAYPRWISHNQNCTPDRMWWSGSGWHC